MARASFNTLLSLDRYARILGINPVAFNGASQINLSDGNILFPIDNAQNNIWPQFAWQNADQISREELARQIWIAESDIASYIGYYPAPKWIDNEVHYFENNFRPEYGQSMYDAKWQEPSVHVNFGYFITGGIRKVTFVSSRSVQYLDIDGDGWPEQAKIEVTLPTATTDIKTVKIFFHDHSGEQEWEIRPVIRKTQVGAAAVFYFDSWLFIDPDISEALPSGEPTGKSVDITETDNFVDTVDAYIETNDFSQPSAVFSTIEKESGAITSTDGFLYSKTGNIHNVVPVPGTYNSTTGAWERVLNCEGYDYFKLNYYAGAKDTSSIWGRYGDYLSDYFATTIAYLATARLDRIFYANNNATSLQDSLRKEMIETEDGKFRMVTDEMSNCPFGTKYGEYLVYKRLSKFVKHLKMGVTVI